MLKSMGIRPLVCRFRVVRYCMSDWLDALDETSYIQGDLEMQRVPEETDA